LDFKKFDLEAAMNVLTKANTGIANDVLEATLRKVQIVGPRGPEGIFTCHPRDGKDGKNGLDGRPGRDAEFKLVIGTVEVGDRPGASLRAASNGTTYMLDLILPRAEKGDRGDTGAASQIPGRDGKDAEPLSLEDLEKVAKRILLDPAHGDLFRGRTGETGESVVGPVGPQGISVNEEMLTGVLLKVLRDIIGGDLILQKMVQVRAEVKRQWHQATSRHIVELQDAYRKIDNIIG
jgi:hypothetical protein